jgi:PhnB protein
MAKKKIDPLNRKRYGAVSAALTVSNIPAAVSFYQKAFGFSKRAIMNGPDGKPVHAELTLRGTTLMLGPESEQMGRRSAKSVGASPATLYIYVENVDKVVEKAALHSKRTGCAWDTSGSRKVLKPMPTRR